LEFSVYIKVAIILHILVGIVAAESRLYYTRQVLCPVFGSDCSDNIDVIAIPGANIIYELTSSAVQFDESCDYEVSLQSSCSVEDVTLGSGDECRLMSIDEGRNSIRFTCGSEGIRGTTANAGVVLFTPSDPVQPSCVGNGTTVLVVVQQGEGGSDDVEVIGGTQGAQIKCVRGSVASILICVCMCMSVCVCVCVCMYVYVCVCAYMCVCMCMCVCVCVFEKQCTCVYRCVCLG